MSSVVKETAIPLAVEENSLVIVGEIGAPYGVRGWHHIHSFTSPLDNILNYQEWYLKRKGQWHLYTFDNGRCHGQGLVAHLKGIDDRDLAATLSLSKIAILREKLAPLENDQFYWTDLEGLTVVSVKGENKGTVFYLYDNAGVDVMVVKCQGKEQHIPFIMHDTVQEVDLKQRKLIIDWEFSP